MEDVLKGMKPLDAKFATKSIHVGQDPEQWNSMAVVPPITLSATFKQLSPGKYAGFHYARCGNPTRQCLEECLAALDNAQYGLCYSSGSAATQNIVRLLKSGDHIICMNDVFGGTNRLFRTELQEWNIVTSFVDCTNLKTLQNAFRDTTRLVWIETPTNPTMRLVDIQAVAEMSHKYNNVTVVVDNTFMTPYFQRPLDLGADVSLYSLTKYMNGHTDSVMGGVTMNDKGLYEKLKFIQNSVGAIPSPFECYLVNRGLKTLHLRMREHMKNGILVARFLEQHVNVEKVIYPGLSSHPQHDLAKRQCSGFTGMLSFYIRGGITEARSFLSNLKLFVLVVSLGGYESLAEHPGLMTHASVPEVQRQELNISDNLIRLSVGLEAAEDIIADLDQALKAAVSQ